MSEQDKASVIAEEDRVLLEVRIKHLLDDYARHHDIMVQAIIVRWVESGEGELVHSVKVNTSR